MAMEQQLDLKILEESSDTRVRGFFHDETTDIETLKNNLSKIISRFSESTQSIINDYIKGDTFSTLSKNHNLSMRSISAILNKLKKNISDHTHIYEKLDEIDSDIKMLGKKEITSIGFVLKEREKLLNKLSELEIDAETELKPFLPSDLLDLYNYTINPTGKRLSDFSQEHGSKHASVTFRKFDTLYRFIEKVHERKLSRAEFAKSLGGEDMVEDIRLFLFGDHLKVYDEIMLSINPHAVIAFKEKYNLTSDVRGLMVVINKTINSVLRRKAETEKFIKENGGEDFLIFEFGQTLSDEQFDVLINVMMDYHYTSLRKYSEEKGESPNFAVFTIQSINKKLEEYKKNRDEVNEMIERAGGVEMVNQEIYSKLNPIQKGIFEDRILAYKPLTKEETCEKYGVAMFTENKIEGELRKALEEMICAFETLKNKN